MGHSTEPPILMWRRKIHLVQSVFFVSLQWLPLTIILHIFQITLMKGWCRGDITFLLSDTIARFIIVSNLLKYNKCFRIPLVQLDITSPSRLRGEAKVIGLSPAPLGSGDTEGAFARSITPLPLSYRHYANPKKENKTSCWEVFCIYISDSEKCGSDIAPVIERFYLLTCSESPELRGVQ